MKRCEESYISFNGQWLGDVIFTPIHFKKNTYDKLKEKKLSKLSSFEKHRFVGATILEEIQLASDDSFLLPAIVDFISFVRDVLLPTYTFNSFELYLNNYTELSEKEEFLIRGKIVGRHIPRSEYQAFFPIGMGGSYKGSHFSLAHFSPDVDTVIASFHGFLDAFAAKVGKGVHYWQVPSGPPEGSIEIDNLFSKALGSSIFDVFVNTSRRLSLSALDLFTQKNIVVKKLSDKSVGIEHARAKKSVIVIDEKGEYIADWRAVDFDEVRMIIDSFILILRLFEKDLYMSAVKFLSKKIDLKSAIDQIMDKTLLEFSNGCSHDLTSKDRLSYFINKVLGFDKGLQTTIGNFLSSVDMLKDVFSKLKNISDDVDLEEYLKSIHTSLLEYFSYLDTLEVAVSVKRDVLNYSPVTLSHLDDYETIVEKMEGYSHLTVVHEENEFMTPLGVVHASDIKANSLATLSIRDFSNSEEMDKASYIDVISCIDHHKSELKTNKPSRMIISDAQSSNSIVAKMNMDINDKYATSGYTNEEILSQMNNLNTPDSPEKMRIMKKLLTRNEAFLQKDAYFVSRDKEFLDYYHFLFAILDDTDLLTKVTPFDVYVVRDLINRMKSLMLKKEVEVINFDDLDSVDVDFAQKAAKKLLRSHDLYSLYKDNYEKKEKNVEDILKKATTTYESIFYQDTKILGKYAEVGQFKLFTENHATFKKKHDEIQKHWLKRCKESFSKHSNLSIFIFMISTIDSAQDLFAGAPEGNTTHKDEIWVSCLPENRESYEKAKRFILNFCKSPKMLPQEVEMYLQGELINSEETIDKVFSNIRTKTSAKSKDNLVQMHINLKSIKSRKSDIAPYL